MRELVAALLLAAGPDAGAPSLPAPAVPAPAAVAPERAPIPQAAAEKVTLADAVKRALERNPDRGGRGAARSIAPRALIKQARAGWYPLLTGNGTLHPPRSRSRHQHDSGQIVASGNQLTANAQLTVPLVAARAWAATRHAESARRIAETSAADVRRQVAQSTARAYLTVVARAPADRGGRDRARQRQGALRLRAHPPPGRHRPRHRRGARAAGPGDGRAPGAVDLRRARAGARGAGRPARGVRAGRRGRRGRSGPRAVDRAGARRGAGAADRREAAGRARGVGETR